MKKSFSLILILIVSLYAKGQVNNDTLTLKSFDYLFNRYQLSKDNLLKDTYANAIVKKAKREQDTIRLIGGYSFKSELSEDIDHLAYQDSIIFITKSNGNKYQPAIAYLTKGFYYYNKGDYVNALENAIKSRSYAKEYINKDLELRSNHYVGVFKTKLGNYKEALTIFKDNLNYYNSIEINPHDFDMLKLNSIHSIALTYNDLNELDSTYYYNKIGYAKSLEINDVKFENYFRLNEGVSLYKQAKYNSAIDSLEKTIDVLVNTEDYPSIAKVNFYLAKSFEKQLNSKKAISYYKKVDSIFRFTNDIHPHLRESYERLINYYENIDDYQNQLVYVNQLIRLDSILHQNKMYLTNKIIKEYDIPNLISEKERIISILENNNSKRVMYFYWLLVLFFVSLIGFIYQYKKRKLYKKRFEEIIRSENSKTNQTLNVESTSKEINIASDLVKTILDGLSTFEKGKAFLDQNFTIQDLAKEINTNATYLSKVVNHYKKVSFTHYINNLRIEYTIEELKKNDIFRKYTLKAIANDVGFKKSESFSSAFVKYAGIKPAYFLKQLNDSEI